VATAAGYDDEDLYYSNKTVEEPVKFEDGPYRARLLFDTAE
jgi:hypothetical protein